MFFAKEIDFAAVLRKTIEEFETHIPLVAAALYIRDAHTSWRCASYSQGTAPLRPNLLENTISLFTLEEVANTPNGLVLPYPHSITHFPPQDRALAQDLLILAAPLMDAGHKAHGSLFFWCLPETKPLAEGTVEFVFSLGEECLAKLQQRQRLIEHQIRMEAEDENFEFGASQDPSSPYNYRVELDSGNSETATTWEENENEMEDEFPKDTLSQEATNPEESQTMSEEYLDQETAPLTDSSAEINYERAATPPDLVAKVDEIGELEGFHENLAHTLDFSDPEEDSAASTAAPSPAPAPEETEDDFSRSLSSLVEAATAETFAEETPGEDPQPPSFPESSTSPLQAPFQEVRTQMTPAPTTGISFGDFGQGDDPGYQFEEIPLEESAATGTTFSEEQAEEIMESVDTEEPALSEEQAEEIMAAQYLSEEAPLSEEEADAKMAAEYLEAEALEPAPLVEEPALSEEQAEEIMAAQYLSEEAPLSEEEADAKMAAEYLEAETLEATPQEEEPALSEEQAEEIMAAQYLSEEAPLSEEEADAQMAAEYLEAEALEATPQVEEPALSEEQAEEIMAAQYLSEEAPLSEEEADAQMAAEYLEAEALEATPQEEEPALSEEQAEEIMAAAYQEEESQAEILTEAPSPSFAEETLSTIVATPPSQPVAVSAPVAPAPIAAPEANQQSFLLRLLSESSGQSFLAFDRMGHLVLLTNDSKHPHFGTLQAGQDALELLFFEWTATNKDSASFSREPDLAMIRDLMQSVFLRITDLEVLTELFPNQLEKDGTTLRLTYHYLQSPQGKEQDRILVLAKDITNEAALRRQIHTEAERSNTIIKVALDLEGYIHFRQEFDQGMAEIMTLIEGDLSNPLTDHAPGLATLATFAQAIYAGAELFDMNDIITLASRFENLVNRFLKEGHELDESSLDLLAMSAIEIQDHLEMIHSKYLEDLVSENQMGDTTLYQITGKKISSLQEAILAETKAKFTLLDQIFEKNYLPFTKLPQLEEITQRRLNAVKSIIWDQVYPRLEDRIEQQTQSLRQQAIKLVLNKYKAIAENLCKRQGKQCEIHLESHHLEVPMGKLSDLFSSLIHIVRNSVEHGIEKMEERVFLGKDLEGRLNISASQDGHSLVLVFEDDGRGMPMGELKHHCLTRGLASESELTRLSNDEIIRLFVTGSLTPGEIKPGQAMGLNSVYQHVYNLGGKLTVDTEEEKGSVFTLTIPQIFTAQ